MSIYLCLDDILLLAQDEITFQQYKVLELQTLQSIWWPIIWEKSQLNPLQRMTFLEVTIDTVKKLVQLVEEKIANIIFQIKLAMYHLKASQCPIRFYVVNHSSGEISPLVPFSLKRHHQIIPSEVIVILSDISDQVSEAYLQDKVQG